MLLTLFLITIVLVALAFAGLGFSIFFRKNGKFPQTEVGNNKNMKNLGITCTKQDEMKIFREEKRSGKPGTQRLNRLCGIAG
ncbi:MAG: hypothetical protein NTV01_00525 [Bacteroidia bacterium]|nr:hypothetical protein [Bacteroidia bacterium]